MEAYQLEHVDWLGIACYFLEAKTAYVRFGDLEALYIAWNFFKIAINLIT